MPERTLIVKPLGLVTQPNKMGQFPDGAMSKCANFVMRAPGQLRMAYSKTAGWTTLSQRPRLLHSTANRLIALQRSAGGVWSVTWVTQALPAPTIASATLPYTTDDFSQTGRLQAITMRGRTVINSASREAIVADYENPSTSTERAFRSIGMLQPRLKFVGSEVGQAVDENSIVAYGAVIKRVYPDGYVLRSRPSVFWRYFNNLGGGAKNVTWNVHFVNGLNYVREGDIVELYRSQSIPSTGTADDDPGATMYLAASKPITASDLTANQVTVTDRAIASAAGGPLGGLGEQLYTNPDFGGLAVSNDPPPTAACMAVFRGRAWYANCLITPTVKWSYGGGLGSLTTDIERANGVGYREGTGTFTSGSAVVTGVSASHILGLAPGQRVFGPVGGLAGATIVSVGATSFTMSASATGSATGTWSTHDVLELDGDTYFVQQLVANLFEGFLDSNYIVNATKSLYDKFQSVVTFQVRKLRLTTPMTIRASNGSKYLPAVTSFPSAAESVQPKQLKNYVRYSHDQQPEAVPSTNEQWVGNGEIYAMVPTRDALWFLCSDGLFRLSGTIAPIEGVPDIRVDPIDAKLVLAGPRAWCVLRDRIFAYTNRGFVSISDDGVVELSAGVVGDLLPGAVWAEAESPFLVADERTDEIYIIGAHETLNFVYSARYGCFSTTTQFDSAQTAVQAASSRALIFGYATSTIDELQPDLTGPMGGSHVVQLDFQPIFGGRPDTLKQFVDATYILDPASSNDVFPRFNGLTSSDFATPINAGNDLRATVGVPCDAPAIAPSLAIGLSVFGTALVILSGISVRYVPITEQVGQR